MSEKQGKNRKPKDETTWDDVPDQSKPKEVKAVPIGRATVDVTVTKVGTKSYRSSTRPVMFIESGEGWSGWGSNKSGAKPGDKIRMTATFKVSDTNPNFVFFQRPATWGDDGDEGEE